MGERKLILITRPVEDAETYAAELESEGFKTLTEPMLEIAEQHFEAPDLSQYRGLVFTSANAVRIFAAASKERNIETYCVGQNTYEQARDLGYNILHNAKGGGEELVGVLLKGERNVLTEGSNTLLTGNNNALTERGNTLKARSNAGSNTDNVGPDNGSSLVGVQSDVSPKSGAGILKGEDNVEPDNGSSLVRGQGDMSPKSGAGDGANIIPFLHVRGEHVAKPIDEMLEAGGIKAETLVVYRAEKVKTLSKICVDKLQNGSIGAVTFFSKRTAENFLSLIDENGLSGALSHIKALCISNGVLECVRTTPWAGTYTASQPDRQGMLDLIRDVHTAPNALRRSKS